MTSPYEAVYLRFRGRMRRLPLLSLATLLRRDVRATATALEILMHGPPDDRPADPPAAPLDPIVGGKGGDRSEAVDRSLGAAASESIGTLGPRDILEPFDPNRSERRAREDDVSDEDLARRIAVDLGDEENVLAIRKLVVEHPRERLDRALRRTLSIPPERVRTSRGALFTTIVRKLAEHAGSQPRT